MLDHACVTGITSRRQFDETWRAILCSMTTTPNSTDDASGRRRRRRNTPLQLRLLRAAFRTLGPVFPGIMAVYTCRLWFRTRRSPEPQREQEFRQSSESFTLQHNGNQLAVNRWGEGPVILLVHGWNGRGAQLGAFVSSLVEQGFQVVAFDTPAHGRSSGTSTNIFEIADAVTHVANHVGELHGVIAHSFGVPSAILAATKGLHIPCMVGISTPANYDELIRPFTRALHIPGKIEARFRKQLEQHLGSDIWHRFSPENMVRDMTGPALVIHDKDDHDIDWHSGKTVADAWPNARFVTTQGLGHRRILRNPQVIEMVTHFMQTKQVNPD